MSTIQNSAQNDSLDNFRRGISQPIPNSYNSNRTIQTNGESFGRGMKSQAGGENKLPPSEITFTRGGKNQPTDEKKENYKQIANIDLVRGVKNQASVEQKAVPTDIKFERGVKSQTNEAPSFSRSMNSQPSGQTEIEIVRGVKQQPEQRSAPYQRATEERKHQLSDQAKDIEIVRGIVQPSSRPFVRESRGPQRPEIDFQKGRAQPVQTQWRSLGDDESWTRVAVKKKPRRIVGKDEGSREDSGEEIAVKNDFKDLNVSGESDGEVVVEIQKPVEPPKPVEAPKIEEPKPVETPKSNLPSIEELKRLAIEREKQQMKSENFYFYPQVSFEIPVLKAVLSEAKRSKLTSDVKELISNYSNQLFKEAIEDNNLSHGEYPELFQIVIMESFTYRDDPDMTPLKNILKSLLSFEYMGVVTMAAGFQLIYGDLEEILLDYPLAEQSIDKFLKFFNDSKLFEYKPNKINEVWVELMIEY